MKSTTKHLKSTPMDWFSYINDDNLRLAIPVGPRFQADVPEWTGPPCKTHGTLDESDHPKRSGVVIWSNDTNPNIVGCVIGKGRPESCECSIPGSIQCVKHHISKKTAHLQAVLGPAFWTWKFDQMGEGFAKSWEQRDQQRLANIMEMNSFSQGQDFIKPALKCFPLKSKKDIVNFYFNVYIPRRMSMQTRSGCMMMINTDDEQKAKSHSNGSRKKAKVANARYLTGRR